MLQLSNMWIKIYLIVLAVMLIAMSFFTYYSWDWLQSIGSPAAAMGGYSYYSNIAWIFLWFASVVLLLIANVALAKQCQSWPMWTTLLFFAVFVVTRYFWLERANVQFQTENGLADVGLSWGPFVAIFLCAAATAFVFFNWFTVLRMSETANPSIREPEIDNKTASTEEIG